MGMSPSSAWGLWSRAALIMSARKMVAAMGIVTAITFLPRPLWVCGCVWV